ncbi:MAG: YwdI family protein [Paenisporosarcina sp.]
MIPLSRLILEIEKHATSAKHQDDTVAREALVAIRALCDVALNERPKSVDLPPIHQGEAPSLRPTEPLQEDGANGDSLFDF